MTVTVGEVVSPVNSTQLLGVPLTHVLRYETLLFPARSLTLPAPMDGFIIPFPVVMAETVKVVELIDTRFQETPIADPL